MKKVREQRLAGEFRKNIYEILTKRVKDENITAMFSVAEVEVANDLKHAKVYVSVFSGTEEEKAATFGAIKNAAGFVRRELGAMMRIRTVPELHFLPDNSAAYGEKIDKILSGLTYGDHDDDN
ncbi:MAG: 30S ribosome-binding factor RbfA [Clostridia bacterium]|nr:30S ribosome-binding factor RbfA [Clostridia bacterium]MBQ9480671.1 30S ribosome-binding factor RbfA [Clostridia bacterium]